MKKILTVATCFTSTLLYGQNSLPDTLQVKILDEVIVSASRQQEKLLHSPVSIEKADTKYFNGNAAPTFFDALQNLKGVQMITPSLGFRVINTRGFSNTTNVRFAQLIDGMDVQSPHIGAAVGNALGPTDLDIKSVEIVPGSASALYGMNTINGLANFTTKNPFTSEGLSFQQKTGVNHVGDALTGAKIFSETSLRFAHVISPRFAFKLNGSFIKGYDWIADDHTDLNAAANVSVGLTGTQNPGIDPVNGYGNESSNRRSLLLQGKSYVVARTGYFEKQIADYSLQNIKADAGLYYKFNDQVTLVYTYHVANFNNVYQRANRFRLQNYLLQQHGLEFSSPSIKAKAYINSENTGQSYNLRSLAENMDKSYKTDDKWFSDYTQQFNTGVTGGLSPADAHQSARTYADAGRPTPGSPAFNNTFSKLQSINNWDSGAALNVKASLVHAEIQADLTQQYLSSLKDKAGLEMLVGLDTRSYIIQPDGNYFINPVQGKNGKNIIYGRWGGFLSVSKRLIHNKLKVGAVMRIDKNDYFSTKTNTRISAVYSPTYAHNIRISYQDGYRYPSIFEAYSNVNSGGVKRVGGLPVMSNGIFEYAWLKSSIDAFQSAVNKDINTLGITKNEAIEKNKGLLQRNSYSYLKPEHVRSFEAGYKGLFLNNRLFADVDFYYNKYTAFIAQVEMSVPNTQRADSVPYSLYDKKTQSRYRMWTNSATTVYNYGAGLRLKYDLRKGYIADGNVSYAKLEKKSEDDGLEDGFNTPQWMANISLSNENIFKNFGAGITYRWQDNYYWQSFLVNGNVPANSSIDAQLSYTMPKLAVRIKVGASNVLNHYYTSFLGGPQVGGFYYTTISYGLN
ncbi:iron complex outermembrane recepter protein [Chitinophaga sp. CF118]|uniref:TonB-dependent receptor n=1 Tax=Chitinophaga sp. CF118 TaxID=1884367 RepID=UPI0008ED8BA1|nr:TonB-dependent receptor [Chitinophaga sp. CF118]SFD01521.1 iron complex outermembrane recepter protein [Chitinophaga sp. CF118]